MSRVNSLMNSRSQLVTLALVGLIVNVSLDARKPLSYSSSTSKKQQDYSENEVAEMELKPIGQCQTQEDQDADLDAVDSKMNKKQKSDEAYQIIDNGCIEQQQEQPPDKKQQESPKYEYPMNSYDQGGKSDWQQSKDMDTPSEEEEGLRVGQKEVVETTQAADEPDDYQIVKTNQGGKTHSGVDEKLGQGKTYGDAQQQEEQAPGQQEQELIPEQRQQQQRYLQEKEPSNADVEQQQQEEQTDVAEQEPEKAADPMLTSRRWQSSNRSESNGANRTPKYLGAGQAEKNRPVNGRTQARLSCQFGSSQANLNREEISNVEWAKFVGEYDPREQDTPSFECRSSSCSVEKIRTDVQTTINSRPKMKKSPTTNRMMPSYSMILHQVGDSQMGVYRCSALRKFRGLKSELVYRIIRLE